MSESKNSKRTGHKFERGNKHGRGRPEGSRNRATILLQQMLAGEAEAITQKAITMAKNGDGLALKLCMERLIPPVKDRHIQLKFPRVHSAEDVIEASSRLVQAVADGASRLGKRMLCRVCLRCIAGPARRPAWRNELQNSKGRLEMANGSLDRRVTKLEKDCSGVSDFDSRLRRYCATQNDPANTLQSA
ncbi:MAG: hypothetical protein ACR2JB_23795 [Bryobacteraceae bacterium]